MTKGARVLSYFTIFLIVFSLGWGVGSFITSFGNQAVGTSNSVNILSGQAEEAEMDLTMFWKVRDILKDNYIDEGDLVDQDLVYGSIKGMTDALEDPYTVYMTPEETAEFNQSLNGELEGIGAELTVRDQFLVVVSPLKDSPAQQAGLLPDDKIFKIDGEVASEMTLFDAIHSIRGEEGTEVVLTIIREGIENPFDVTIERGKITVESVSKEEVAEDIWQITVNQFSDDTKQEFNRIVNEISLEEPSGLILDLRFNGGGYLTGSVDIVSAFMRNKQEIVRIEYRDNEKDEVFLTTGNGQLPDVPLVVLVNRGSASAAEIVAAAVQDLKRGVVLGETTFGKGTVQEVDPLADGSSIRFTIARWFTPNGRNIDEVGVEPDQEVMFTDEDYENGNDPQLDAAIDYLQNL